MPLDVNEQSRLVRATRASLRYLAGSKTAGRLLATSCIVAVAILSLLPSAMTARTGVGGHIEHMVAYAGTAFVAAAVFSAWARVAIALLAYAGALEIMQHLSPGRTPSLADFMFSAGGILAGIGALALLAGLLASRKLPHAPPAA